MNNILSFTKGIFNNQINLSEEKNRNELFKNPVVERNFMSVICRKFLLKLALRT